MVKTYAHDILTRNWYQKLVPVSGTSFWSVCHEHYKCSMTLLIHAWTVQHTKMHFAPYDRAMFLVSWCQISWSWVKVKQRYLLSKTRIW